MKIKRLNHVGCNWNTFVIIIIIIITTSLSLVVSQFMLKNNFDQTMIYIYILTYLSINTDDWLIFIS